MKHKDKQIECPGNPEHEDLSLHLTTQATFMRIPIKNGKPVPADILMRDVQLAGDSALVRYSDIERDTRITLSTEKLAVLIHCPSCKKMYDLPKGVSISCKDVD
jgi:hypothetical protein